MTILQPNHILQKTPHNIQDSRRAKRRLSKLVQLLEVDSCEAEPIRSPELESIIRRAKAITKRFDI